MIHKLKLRRPAGARRAAECGDLQAADAPERTLTPASTGRVGVKRGTAGRRRKRVSLCAWLVLACTLLVHLFTAAQRAEAIPQYARRHNLQCGSCHVLPPKLNTYGEAFLARGYRLEPEEDKKAKGTIPLSLWATGRSDTLNNQFSKLYVNRVELISGGPIGRRDNLSYFLEWRAVSLETRADGTLLDRSGRFEDVLLNLPINSQNIISVGQYRALRQVDVSRRLSITEPAVFSTSLPGKAHRDARVGSLRGFSPSGRSPGFTYQWQPIVGERPSDGLFHAVTLPFGGEFSLPLTDEARRDASFELEGRPKGVFLESFYRTGLDSIGVHGFIDRGRWLAQGVGTLQRGKVFGIFAAGVSDQPDSKSRLRYSAEAEYLLVSKESLRAMLGFRVEQVTNAGRDPAYIPYISFSGPNTDYSFLATIQYRRQKNSDALFVEFGGAF